jgi:hypothetical protein
MSAETLLDIFVPPEGMVGHSAALVAMTGTEDFLEDAMQRFTGLRPRQRAELGYVLVYLMLDGHESSSRREVFPPGRIPGSYEFQPRGIGPGSLLHAKVALLAFARTRTGDPVHLRLAVLTANFTYTSARQQLELAWVVDAPIEDKARIAPQKRADLRVAGEFIIKLTAERFYRDDSSITSRLKVLLRQVSEIPPTNRKPRFIHSLERPLYDQIQERFRSAIGKPRNLLLCGSGFYEESSGKARKPYVFGKLEDLGVFTANVQRVALVEPGEAGAIATWAKGGETDGWEVVRPFDALNHNRRLHAKFVCAGYLRDGYMSNGWLYLGSGNLSRRGILTDGTMAEGNVETGVVFAVDERLDAEAIERCLFWSDDVAAVAADDWVVGQVGDSPQTESMLEAPPVLSATIEPPPARRLRLLWREDVQAGAGASISWTGRDWFEVQQGDDVPLKDDENPPALHVRGANDRDWLVAVIDAAGRVGWQPPRFDNYADALAALLDFPIRTAEATDDDSDGGEDRVGKGTGAGGTIEQEKTYALHAAADLIEKLAALQAALPKARLDDWLDHLDRMFRASFPEALITTWRSYRLDVFAHLREPELRSRHLTDKQRARYFEVLDGVARAWGLR